MSELKVTDIGIVPAILRAIKQAHISNVQIVEIGLPQEAQEELKDYLMANMRVIKDKNKGKIRKGQIGEAFGIPIVSADRMQITTEFSRFEPLSL